MPLLILAIGALVVLLLGAVVPGRYGSWTAVVCCLAAALWTLQMPPQTTETLGIAGSPLAGTYIIFFCLLAAAVLVISLPYNEQRAIHGEEYPATVLFATFGMIALTVASSLLTLFIGLEAMTFGFYLLVAMELRRDASSEAGLKYLLLGAVAAGFLAFGMALLYFVAGSLQSAAVLRMASGEPLALVGWGCLLVGVAFKLSLVPAHLWTPDVYQGAPAPVAAFLSGGSKAAAVLFTVLLLDAAGSPRLLYGPLLMLALLSVVIGNLAALRQQNIRRMLAYSAVGQMGYVVLALLSGAAGGYRAALYYAIIYSLMSLAAFGAIALFEQAGTGDRIDDYRGGSERQPLAAALLALAMFALAGIPPTAGFTGKFMIFAALLKQGEIAAAVIGILAAAASAYFYLRVVVVLYVDRNENKCSGEAAIGDMIVLLTVSLLLLLLGLFPTPLLDLLILPGR